MKTIFYYLSVVLLVASFGCGDDDAPASVAGTWTVERYDIVSTISTNGESNTVNSTITGKNGTDLLMIFNESPNTYTFEGEPVLTSTTTQDGTTSTATEDLESNYSGTWTRDGNTLTLIDPDGEEVIMTLDELTGNTLRSGGEYTVVLDFAGVELTTDISAELVLSR